MAKQAPYVDTSKPEFSALQHPKYLAARAKWAELQAKVGELSGRIRGELTRASFLRMTRDNAAHALVFGGDSPAPCAGPSADVNELIEEREVVAIAVRLAEKRVIEVEKEVSAEICDKVRDAYIAANVAVWKALRDLSPVLKKEQAIVSGLHDGGTRPGLLPLIGIGLSVDGMMDHLAANLRETFGVDPAAD